MHLTLFVPDLFWPDTMRPEIYQNLSLDAIEKLLCKGATAIDSPEDLEIWLCKRFNVEQRINWPIAPIMLQKDAPELTKNNKEFWMRADPVHLRIEQNHLMLADSRIFAISKEEADRLVQDLNCILHDYHLTLLALHADRWYIQLPKMPAMQTYTLGQVTCKNINQFLPTGADSAMWRKLLNEIQMRLHEHPINQARESSGELSINSIWFWGGGYSPGLLRSTYTNVWSNNELSLALAMAAQTPHADLPSNLTAWLESQQSGNHLMVLDALSTPAKYRNAYGWRETIKEMEKKWFMPLYEGLKRGLIDQLQLITSNENALQKFTLTRTDLWKFWLVRKPMHTYGRISAMKDNELM